MKKAIYIFGLTLLAMLAKSQTNPYAQFGDNTQVLHIEPYMEHNNNGENGAAKIIMTPGRINYIDSSGLIIFSRELKHWEINRFLSVDPLTKDFPWYTPYQFAGNKPINSIDMEGLEEFVVIRWYDNAGQWTGSSMLRIENTLDRPLGQNGVLFLQLMNNPQNQGVATTLYQAQNLNWNRSSRTFVTNTLRTQGIIDNNNNIIDATRAFFEPIQSPNASENTDLLGLRQMSLNGSMTTGHRHWQRPGSEIIDFSYNSSTYNGNLDLNSLGRTNDDALNGMVTYLNNNPELTVNLIGNSSTEDATGNINGPLSNARSQSVANQLITNGISPSRINITGQGANAPINTNPNQNNSNNSSVNRNVQVDYDLPRRNP